MGFIGSCKAQDGWGAEPTGSASAEALPASVTACYGPACCSGGLCMHTHWCCGAHLDLSLVRHGDIELVPSYLETLDSKIMHWPGGDTESASRYVGIEAQVSGKDHHRRARRPSLRTACCWVGDH